MTILNGNYPNEQDFEQKFLHPKKGIVRTVELPLSDPSTSTWTNMRSSNKFREMKPSAFNLNKVGLYTTIKPLDQGKRRSRQNDVEERTFNQQAHDKWNAHKMKRSFENDA